MLAWLNRYRLQLLAGLLAVIVVVAGVGLIFPSVIGRDPTQTIVARFADTPGLYEDNAVDILGVPTGTVSSVKATAGYVEVRMSLPKHVKIPADARAILMSPNPVSDRTIELYPPYTKGPVMASGAVIPTARTAAPLSVDQIFAAVDDLTKALGPKGANKDGSLSRVVHSLAELTRGNGKNLQNTLAALASALPAFTSDPTQISDLIDNLDGLSKTLAQHNSSIDALFSDVAKATSELADERQTLASAISNLQTGLAQVAQFIRQNRDSIKGSVHNLAVTSQALISDQKALTTTFSTAALGFQNFNRAVDVNAPCAPGEGSGTCPVVFGRIDFPANIETIIKTYCHPAVQEGLPVVVGTVPGLKQFGLKGITTADTINTLCIGEYGAVQGRGGSPGVPATPDLGLSRFLH